MHLYKEHALYTPFFKLHVVHALNFEILTSLRKSGWSIGKICASLSSMFSEHCSLSQISQWSCIPMKPKDNYSPYNWQTVVV